AQVDLGGVAAAIVGMAGVHGLVHVADEVDHELQRLQPFGVAAGGVGEDRGLGVDGLDHAVAAGAVARGLVAAAALADVDVVPARAAPAEVGVGAAQFVGPGGDPGQRAVFRVFHAGQQRVDPGPRG